jgi:hypothetical protein
MGRHKLKLKERNFDPKKRNFDANLRDKCSSILVHVELKFFLKDEAKDKRTHHNNTSTRQAKHEIRLERRPSQDKERQRKTKKDKERQRKTKKDKDKTILTRHSLPQDKTWFAGIVILLIVPILSFAFTLQPRQDKTRQDKTRQGKARQGKTRQGIQKARPYNSQDRPKTRQDHRNDKAYKTMPRQRKMRRSFLSCLASVTSEPSSSPSSSLEPSSGIPKINR